MDRRVQKTRKLLSQALIDLILEQGYEQVTVQDILDRANVGRSTFYAHYKNKELLLLDGPRNLGLSLFGEQRASAKSGVDRPRMDFRDLFRHVSENLPLAQAMLGKKAGNIMMKSFHRQITRAIKDHYSGRYSGSKIEKLLLKYLAQAAAAAVCALLAFWVDDDLSLTADDLSMRCHQMVEAILR